MLKFLPTILLFLTPFTFKYETKVDRPNAIIYYKNGRSVLADVNLGAGTIAVKQKKLANANRVTIIFTNDEAWQGEIKKDTFIKK